jgi:hypothetical protein
MIINRVGPVSCARIMGTLYAILGLIGGAFISLFALAGGMTSERTGGVMIGPLVGVGAIVMLPIIYGLCGFIATLIGAWLYNVVAGIVGGVEIDVR